MQATITAKGQVTLPKALRDQLQLSPGDRVEFIVEEGNVVRMLPRLASITNLKAMLPKPEKSVSLQQMDDAITEGASSK